MQADAQGELAFKPGWPSMFRCYLGEPRAYQKCFADNYYLTGDLMKRDSDGYFWFLGRVDDIKKSAVYHGISNKEATTSPSTPFV